jgi:sugar (pentulose or hexulose) kinase
MSNSGYALGIDLGTSGTRACVIDSQGKIIAEQRVAGQNISRPQPGWAEQRPEVWWSDVVAVIHNLDVKIRERISSLAIDGTSATLLLCDSQGQVCTPALMYNDARAQDQAMKIRTVAPAESGAHGASSSLAKLLWLLENKPSSPPAYALHQADWVNARLSGRWGFSDSNNALKLGYDPLLRCWPEWLDQLDINLELLPEVLTPGETLGEITRLAAHETGLPEHTRITAGTTDSIAAFIATGASQLGDAVTSLGSTLVIKVISEHPISAPKYGIYSHKYGDAWLVGGASNSGGAVLKQYFSAKELATYSIRIDPNQPSDLDYYPLPSIGERFPIADSKYRPRLEPIPDGDPVRFLHGLLEGIGRIEQLGYKRLAELGAPATGKTYTVGGGSINPQWQVIRERLLGKSVEIPKYTEAAYGAARLAARSYR